MSKVYIYTLSDDTGIRYVGQTNNSKIRLIHHKREALTGRDKTTKGLWLKQLLDNGNQPVMSIVDEVEESEAYSKENYLMWYYASLGYSMLNNELIGITQDYAVRHLRLLDALNSGDFSR